MSENHVVGSNRRTIEAALVVVFISADQCRRPRLHITVKFGGPDSCQGTADALTPPDAPSRNEPRVPGGLIAASPQEQMPLANDQKVDGHQRHRRYGMSEISRTEKPAIRAHQARTEPLFSQNHL